MTGIRRDNAQGSRHQHLTKRLPQIFYKWLPNPGKQLLANTKTNALAQINSADAEQIKTESFKRKGTEGGGKSWHTHFLAVEIPTCLPSFRGIAKQQLSQRCKLRHDDKVQEKLRVKVHQGRRDILLHSSAFTFTSQHLLPSFRASNLLPSSVMPRHVRVPVTPAFTRARRAHTHTHRDSTRAVRSLRHLTGDAWNERTHVICTPACCVDGG